MSFVEHHACHAYAPAFFFQPADDWLVLTMDGAGDDDFCTVDVWRNGTLERISHTSWLHSLGYVYGKTTPFLGMKALEHEYKVMGLAAYSKPAYCQAT